MEESQAGPSRDHVEHPKLSYLNSLNQNQLKAVTSPPSIPLQILAGPGSGKTRVLTSRVAHLVRQHGFRPNEITAVTFTNKAAGEMRKRLEVLLGKKAADGLVLGTFHATCAKYLRRFGGIIDLPNNFAICDAEDCKKIMSGLLKAKSDVLEAARMSLKEGAVLSEISKAKAKEESPDGMAIRAAQDPSSSTSTLSVIAELYEEYEASLRESNSLDFDDLLVFGLRLFRTAPNILATCRHILVDEFQDTNTTQYELMKCFAKAHGGVSVVGDPDQSIYGWRSAEVENLRKMERDFAGCQAIYLEENYRSTGSILAAAHSVVTQDRDRIQKSLYTSHPKSTPVTLKVFATPIIEASFIATEIKRLIAYSGGVLNYGDFAILLRYNALSRVIESALQKDSVPNRIVGGHKFFERMEIKDMLAYLQLAENPNFTPAFMRVVNVPRRAIGDKSVADLVSAAKAQKVSPMELSERIIDGDKLPAGLKPAIKRNLATFVGIVRKLRRAAERGTSVADLIRLTIEKTGYEEYLRTSQQDFDSRWENVQELVTYSVTVAEEQQRDVPEELPLDEGFQSANSAAMEAIVEHNAKIERENAEKKIHPMFRRGSEDSSRSRSASVVEEKKAPVKGLRGKSNGGMGKVPEEAIEIDLSDEEGIESAIMDKREEAGAEKAEKDPQSMTPLTYFLQTSMLSTDTEAENDESSKLKVIITTVHSSKGLEWPVVFIPAVEQGTYPSYRCTEAHEIAEERRLLYVAMTRAQTFLTLSYCQFRMMGGEENDKVLSEFVTSSKKQQPDTFSDQLPDVDEVTRSNIAGMLERPTPNETATKDLIMKHVRAAPPMSMWDEPEPRDRQFNRFARREVTKAARAAEYWTSEFDEYALPDSANGSGPSKAGFRPARDGYHGPINGHSRMGKPYPTKPGAERPAPAPVIKLEPTKHNLPAPLPFTFNEPRNGAPKVDIGGFGESSNSSLALMKSLGVTEDDELPLLSGGSSPAPINSSPVKVRKKGVTGGSVVAGGVGGGGGGGFVGRGKADLDGWKDLGLDDVGVDAGIGGGGGSRSRGGGVGDVKLARGTKRLGMGRPAPWGSKRARGE